MTRVQSNNNRFYDPTPRTGLLHFAQPLTRLVMFSISPTQQTDFVGWQDRTNQDHASCYGSQAQCSVNARLVIRGSSLHGTDSRVSPGSTRTLTVMVQCGQRSVNRSTIQTVGLESTTGTTGQSYAPEQSMGPPILPHRWPLFLFAWTPVAIGKRYVRAVGFNGNGARVAVGQWVPVRVAQPAQIAVRPFERYRYTDGQGTGLMFPAVTPRFLTGFQAPQLDPVYRVGPASVAPPATVNPAFPFALNGYGGARYDQIGSQLVNQWVDADAVQLSIALWCTLELNHGSGFGYQLVSVLLDFFPVLCQELDSGGFRLSWNAPVNQLSFAWCEGALTRSVQAVAPVSSPGWHHVAVSVSRNFVQLYVNGQPLLADAYAAAPVRPTKPVKQDLPLMISCEEEVAFFCMLAGQSLADVVILVGEAVTQEQVMDMYTNGYSFPALDTPTAAQVSFANEATRSGRRAPTDVSDQTMCAGANEALFNWLDNEEEREPVDSTTAVELQATETEEIDDAETTLMNGDETRSPVDPGLWLGVDLLVVIVGSGAGCLFLLFILVCVCCRVRGRRHGRRSLAGTATATEVSLSSVTSSRQTHGGARTPGSSRSSSARQMHRRSSRLSRRLSSGHAYTRPQYSMSPFTQQDLSSSPTPPTPPPTRPGQQVSHYVQPLRIYNN